MKNVKRILALLSAAVMLFGFASCKGSDEPTATTAPVSTASVTESTTAEETTTVPETTVPETTTAEETTPAPTTAAPATTKAVTTKKATTTKKAETTKAAVKAPTDKAQILKVFNDASAKVVSAKPGFTKKVVTTVPNLEMGALAKIKIVRETISSFLGEGSSTVSVAKGKSNSSQYVKSTLKASDLTKATCKLSADGKTYDIVLTVKNEQNPLKGKSALGRFTKDYKDAAEIKQGLDEAGVTLDSLTMTTTSVVITAKVDAASGHFISLKYDVKTDAKMSNVKYTVARVKVATGKMVNSVTFSNFKY